MAHACSDLGWVTGMVRGWAGELETRELCEKPFCSKHAFLSLVGKQFWHLAWFGMGWTGGYGWRWDEPAGRSWDRPLSVVEWLIGFAVWKWLFSGETGEVDCLLNFWTVYLLSQMFEEKLVSKKKILHRGILNTFGKEKGSRLWLYDADRVFKVSFFARGFN